jgi:hypothetical protein
MTSATGRISTLEVVTAVFVIAAVWVAGAFALWSVGNWAVGVIESQPSPRPPFLEKARAVIAVLTLVLIATNLLKAVAAIWEVAAEHRRDRRRAVGGSSAGTIDDDYSFDVIDEPRSPEPKTPHGAPPHVDGAASRPGASDSPLNLENTNGHLR